MNSAILYTGKEICIATSMEVLSDMGVRQKTFHKEENLITARQSIFPLGPTMSIEITFYKDDIRMEVAVHAEPKQPFISEERCENFELEFLDRLKVSLLANDKAAPKTSTGH